MRVAISGVGVAVVGPDGAAPVPPGPAAGLVAHHLVDDPGREAGVLQPGREGVPEVMGAVEVDRIQQRMVGGWPQHPACFQAVAGGGAGLGQLLEGTADGGERGGAPPGAQLGGELLGTERATVAQRRQGAGGGRAEPGGGRVGELGQRAVVGAAEVVARQHRPGALPHPRATTLARAATWPGEQDGGGVAAGRKAAADRLHDLGGQGNLTDAGIALWGGA